MYGDEDYQQNEYEFDDVDPENLQRSNTDGKVVKESG